MRYIWQHISAIIATYNGSLPLAHFLKNYFKQNPKLGSRDRKMLSTFAYSWYRCSKGIGTGELEIGSEDKLRACLKLCNNELPLLFPPSPQPENDMPFDISKLFPYDIAFSDGINKKDWLRSMLVQPDLFIRIRTGKANVTKLLDGCPIPYTFISDTCISFPNSTKTEGILPADSYVVQDVSSQKTGDFFHPQKNESWYDCCCGAGGKALLLKDMEPRINLTVSDIRESIVSNLTKRFAQYHHTLPQTYIADVADKSKLSLVLKSSMFSNIVCDAPCSGSGTWARTPEQLYFFKPESLKKFTILQKKISINVASYLEPGGSLFYITCSVFKEENEDVVDEIMKQTNLQLEQSHLINGIGIHADSMFIAVLKK